MLKLWRTVDQKIVIHSQMMIELTVVQVKNATVLLQFTAPTPVVIHAVEQGGAASIRAIWRGIGAQVAVMSPDKITLAILSVFGKDVLIGFDAPKHVRIDRLEIYHQKQRGLAP